MYVRFFEAAEVRSRWSFLKSGFYLFVESTSKAASLFNDNLFAQTLTPATYSLLYWNFAGCFFAQAIIITLLGSQGSETLLKTQANALCRGRFAAFAECQSHKLSALEVPQDLDM